MVAKRETKLYNPRGMCNISSHRDPGAYSVSMSRTVRIDLSVRLFLYRKKWYLPDKEKVGIQGPLRRQCFAGQRL